MGRLIILNGGLLPAFHRGVQRVLRGGVPPVLRILFDHIGEAKDHVTERSRLRPRFRDEVGVRSRLLLRR